MIRQSFVYDEKEARLVPKSPDDSYPEKVQREREQEKGRRETLERLEHPGTYL